MKILVSLLTLLSVLINSELKAQNYFAKNTTWVYDKPSYNIFQSSYTTLTSLGDSIFNGDTLTYIHGVVNCTVGENSLLKQVDKKVYRLNTCDSTYSLLYDFGAEIGDTLFFESDHCEFEDTILVVVDTIFQTNINGIDKKTFYLTQIYYHSNSFYGLVIEGIGNINNFYPMLGTCDPNGSELRCYTDSILGEYNTGMNGGDCYFNNLNNNEIETEYTSLLPNPNKGTFKLLFNSVKNNTHITIINSIGLTVFEKDYLETQEVTISEQWPAGIYFIQISHPNHVNENFKFIVD